MQPAPARAATGEWRFGRRRRAADGARSKWRPALLYVQANGSLRQRQLPTRSRTQLWTTQEHWPSGWQPTRPVNCVLTPDLEEIGVAGIAGYVRHHHAERPVGQLRRDVPAMACREPVEGRTCPGLDGESAAALVEDHLPIPGEVVREQSDGAVAVLVGCPVAHHRPRHASGRYDDARCRRRLNAGAGRQAGSPGQGSSRYGGRDQDADTAEQDSTTKPTRSNVAWLGSASKARERAFGRLRTTGRTWLDIIWRLCHAFPCLQARHHVIVPRRYNRDWRPGEIRTPDLPPRRRSSPCSIRPRVGANVEIVQLVGRDRGRCQSSPGRVSRHQRSPIGTMTSAVSGKLPRAVRTAR